MQNPGPSNWHVVNTLWEQLRAILWAHRSKSRVRVPRSNCLLIVLITTSLLSTKSKSITFWNEEPGAKYNEHHCQQVAEICCAFCTYLHLLVNLQSCLGKSSIWVNPQLHIIWMLALSVWSLDALPTFTGVFLRVLHFPPTVQRCVNQEIF